MDDCALIDHSSFPNIIPVIKTGTGTTFKSDLPEWLSGFCFARLVTFPILVRLSVSGSAGVVFLSLHKKYFRG